MGRMMGRWTREGTPMAKKTVNQLWPLKVASLQQPGCYLDGLGLFFDIGRKAAARPGLFRFQSDGKRRNMGLGPVHSVSLAEARIRAREARQVVIDGRDPIEARKDAAAAAKAERLRTVTYAEAVGQFLSTAKVADFKNDKHRKQWKTTLESV